MISRPQYKKEKNLKIILSINTRRKIFTLKALKIINIEKLPKKFKIIKNFSRKRTNIINYLI